MLFVLNAAETQIKFSVDSKGVLDLIRDQFGIDAMGKVASSAVASQGAPLTALTRQLPQSWQVYVDSAIEQLLNASQNVPGAARGYIEEVAKLANLESSGALLATAFILTAAAAMSRWGSSFWSDRLSPFGSRNAAPNVTEDDFSYIRPQDLQDTSHGLDGRRPGLSMLPDDDVIFCRNRGTSFPVKFPAHSIRDGKLEVRDLRERAAGALNLRRPSHLRLIYQGQTLKDDLLPCRDYGLRHDAEVLCMVGDGGSDSVSEEENSEVGTAGSGSKGKRNKKTKKGRGAKKDANLAQPNGSPQAGASIPSQSTPRQGSPAPVRPKTPKDKLQEISSHFNTQILPLCVQFSANPPSDSKKRELERLKLEEVIMREVLLKLDAVETEGDPEARQMRKDLVKTAQGVLDSMDAHKA